MSRRSILEQFIIGFALFGMLLTLMGTKACQEDYYLGSQSTVATLTPTPTEEGDDGDGTITRTSTPTATATETSESGSTATATATPTEESDTEASSILNELALLNKSESKDQDEEETEDNSEAANSADGNAHNRDSSNWLGKAFGGGSDDVEEQVTQTIDRDQDGYADWLEEESGTSPDDPRKMPEPPRITLDSRMKGIDSDIDGLPNTSEARNGTDKTIADTDGDGYLDGLEVLAGSDPKNFRSKPVDSDGDGASDELEAQRGFDPDLQDSDGDGLNDGLEIVLRTNGLDPDTDKDGVLDGKEYELGSDPAQSERQ